MPKKKPQLDKRLDDLFEGIKPDEAPVKPRSVPPAVEPPRPPRSARTPVKTEARSSVPPAAAVRTQSLYLEQGNEDIPASLSLAFQMDQSSWATLRATDDSNPRSWSTDEQMLVKQVTDQLSLALENARLFQETQKRAEQLALINRIVTRASATLEVRRSLTDIAQEINSAFSADAVTISLLTAARDAMEVVANFSLFSTTQGVGSLHPLAENPVLQAILESGKPFVIPEVPDKPLSPGMKSFLEDIGTRTLAIVPMLSKNQPIGLIGLHLKDPSRSFTQEELTLAVTVTSQVSTVVENARLLQDVQDRVTQQEVIAQITDAALNAAGVPELLAAIHEAVKRVLPARNFQVALYDREQDLLSFPYFTDEHTSWIPEQHPGRDLTAYVLQTGKALLATPEVYAELERKGKVAETVRQVVDWLGVPLRTSSAVYGVMSIQTYDFQTRLTDKEKEVFSLLGNQVSAAIERLQARAALSKSESELRALFTSMEDVVLVVDRDARYLRIAPTNPSRLVRPPDELLGHLMEEFVPAETAARFKEALARTLDTGETVQVEYELPIDGKPFWFLANLSKMDAGTVFWVARDITSRKHAEQEIAKFKMGIEKSVDAVFMTATDGTITYVNSAFEKIYGYTPEEAIGKTPRILESGPLAQEQDRGFWDAMLSGQTVSGEITYRTRDGSLIPISGTNTPITDENGVVQGFLSIHHDITEARKAEEALQRRATYLSASADIGRLITSTLDLPTIFTRTVNLVAERFGYYHAAIFLVDEGRAFAALEEATGTAGATMKERRHKLPVGSNSIVGEVTRSGSVVVVNDVVQSDLHRFNPLLPETRAEAAIPLRAGGRTIGALDIQAAQEGAFSEDDIAVLQTLADQVAVSIENARSYEISVQAVKEMREVDRLKTQFLANMSHELRTPLNSIIGFSRVILKGIDGPITELQQNDLTAIYNSGQHLLGLINDILDLSKIEAGKMDLAFEEVNVSDVITSVMSTATGLVKDKPIRLVKKVPEDIPHVNADPIRVRQVLINLFSNAAKFTDEGEITVEAAVEKGLTGQPMVRIGVTDSGPGIDEKDQGKLFQAFSQVDDSPTRKTGGSGLGLSISQRLVHMHGGEIGLHSQLGQGSTFFFTLPVHSEPETEIPTGKVILAIDDDPQVISLYERYLKEEGYQVIPLTDPSKAVERVAELKPFAITLDIMMPGIDGWQVLSSLKSNPETRDIPVMICSIIEEQERGFSLGAADYLVKPILEEELIRALDRLNADGSIYEVLVIDDDPNDLNLMGRMLNDQGSYKPILAQGGPRGWEILLNHPPQAVVLDLFMPEMDGFGILQRMHARKDLRDIPVIVVSGADLTPGQKQQLSEFGRELVNKSTLTEKELIASIEKALTRLKSR